MVQKLAKALLQEAVSFGASDVYILPVETTFAISFRRFESRQHYIACSATEGQSLISHFKFTAGMNVGEKRRPQLGACTYEIGERGMRLRLSTAGDFENRESLVIRLLPDQAQPLLFWDETTLRSLKTAVVSRGLYLFSGPVGSGKTTLMHHVAKANFADKQVITIEDPVELVRPELLQFQLNEAIGNTYDSLIKLSLRHMPDLVIVGEIRDSTTARAVIRASLTGYTVFSTIHAKSVRGVYARLLALGVSKDELENALSGIIYQRLIAGKGVLTYADKNFSNHSHDGWNRQIEALVRSGSIRASQATVEKIIS